LFHIYPFIIIDNRKSYKKSRTYPYGRMGF